MAGMEGGEGCVFRYEGHEDDQPLLWRDPLNDLVGALNEVSHGPHLALLYSDATMRRDFARRVGCAPKVLAVDGEEEEETRSGAEPGDTWMPGMSHRTEIIERQAANMEDIPLDDEEDYRPRSVRSRRPRSTGLELKICAQWS